ncbi:MAG: hypothetical protein ACKOAZ_08700 [Ilumatobacteraceae bacterium]
MGIFTKTAKQQDLDSLQAELAALRERLDTAETAKRTLEARLAELDSTTRQLAQKPAPPPDPALVSRLDSLTGKVMVIEQSTAQAAAGMADIAQLAERLAANDAAVRANTEQLGALEQRITSVSIELANQINELGSDIDALASLPAGSTAGGSEPGSISTLSDEVLDALRSAQVRLASEQARYEIAFREDLAALAEQIRRAARS